MAKEKSARLHLVADADSRFIEIYETHFRHVYAYCRRRSHPDRVDDSVADVFLVAWRRIDEAPEAPLPWLYGIAYRVMGQQWRGRARKRKLDSKLAAVGAEPATASDTPILQNAEMELVAEALSRLHPTDQEILRLSIWEELPHPETAEILGLTEVATRKRLSRAKSRLTETFNRLEKRRSIPPAAQEGGAL